MILDMETEKMLRKKGRVKEITLATTCRELIAYNLSLMCFDVLVLETYQNAKKGQMGDTRDKELVCGM